MLVLLLLASVFASYLYLKFSYGYWKKRGVPHPQGQSLLFGDVYDTICMKKSFPVLYHGIYKTFKDCLYVGFYNVRKPALLIRDPDLIKDVLIRDFKSFHDNDFDIDEKSDPIFGKNPFVLRGARWKIARNQMVPCFTSGKMKSQFNYMLEVGSRLKTYLEKNEGEANAGMEAKELVGKFACDSVALCSFGLNVMAFEDPKSTFREMARKIFDTSFIMNVKQMSILFLPSFAGLFGIKLISDEVQGYIRSLMNQTVKYRKDNDIVQNDFLGYMMQLKDKNSENFTDEDLHAHVGGLFIDGLETSSIAMAFTIFELAANPEVQQRLREEIDVTYEKCGGQMTYEIFQQMEYLDCVFKESLRKYPPLPVLSKVCTESFTMPPADSNSKPLTVQSGTSIVISNLGLHYDEKYFPEPERFEPDRFSKENIDKIPKCSYLPFGDGPRFCLGKKFGEQQSKVAVMCLVKDFEIRLNEKTKASITFDASSFLLGVKGGIWLNLYKRR